MAAVEVSVFGKPINHGTRTERAKAAAKYRNADGKLDQVLQASLHFEKAATGEVHSAGDHHKVRFTHPHMLCGNDGSGRTPITQVTRTSCFIYNATGDPITFVISHNWEGLIAGRSPTIIQNGQWAFLKHVGEPNGKGSIGAVVYNIQNYADSMIAWSNPTKTVGRGKNTVYCQMNDPGYFNSDVDWNEMYHCVRDSGTEFEASMEGFTTKVRIDGQGKIPRFWAEFYLDED